MKSVIKHSWLIFLFLLFTNNSAQSIDDIKKQITRNDESLQHRLDRLEKLVDDVLWFQRVGDVAFVDKIFMTGPPPAKEKILPDREPVIRLNSGLMFSFPKESISIRSIR